jgi:hypothetical protein
MQALRVIVGFFLDAAAACLYVASIAIALTAATLTMTTTQLIALGCVFAVIAFIVLAVLWAGRKWPGIALRLRQELIGRKGQRP